MACCLYSKRSFKGQLCFFSAPAADTCPVCDQSCGPDPCCGLDHASAHGFYLCVVPHSDPASVSYLRCLHDGHPSVIFCRYLAGLILTSYGRRLYQNNRRRLFCDLLKTCLIYASSCHLAFSTSFRHPSRHPHRSTSCHVEMHFDPTLFENPAESRDFSESFGRYLLCRRVNAACQ